MRESFMVFGDPVVLALTRAETNGAIVVVRQTCGPGGGPPPHRHENEDEIFQTLSGRFELFDGQTGRWTELEAGQAVFSPKGQVHSFRNCGEESGTIQILVLGGRLDEFLPGLSRFQMPGDMQAMVDYSAAYGITYPGLPAPTQVGERELASR